MKFAVLLPFYNAEKTIALSLNSVACQTQRADEVILINDGSIDNSEAIAREYSLKYGWKIYSNNSNCGIVKSLNIGLSRCSSDWIVRLDADDIWLETHMQALSEGLLQNNTSSGKPYVLMANKAWLIDKTSGYRKETTGPLNEMQLKRELLRDNPIVHSAVTFRRDAAMQIGGYKNVKWEDYDLWIRLLAVGSGKISSQITCEHYLETNGLSRGNRREALRGRLEMQVQAAIFFHKAKLSWFGVYSRSKTRIQLALERVKWLWH